MPLELYTEPDIHNPWRLLSDTNLDAWPLFHPHDYSLLLRSPSLALNSRSLTTQSAYVDLRNELRLLETAIATERRMPLGFGKPTVFPPTYGCRLAGQPELCITVPIFGLPRRAPLHQGRTGSRTQPHHRVVLPERLAAIGRGRIFIYRAEPLVILIIPRSSYYL